jgi:hypothetical protein
VRIAFGSARVAGITREDVEVAVLASERSILACEVRCKVIGGVQSLCRPSHHKYAT